MFMLSEIAEITGGTLSGADAKVSAISTDTRTLKKGNLFIAIKGDKFDGNDYVAEAAAKGAAGAVVDKPGAEKNAAIPTILVDNSRSAQLALARAYRDRFSIKLCAVTGSVGKTTTKDMIHAVLSAKYRTHFTHENLNNEIGVPRTLFGLNRNYGAAVVELGMTGLGEIHALSTAAHPDCAVITNIGYSHIERLGSRENIMKAKLEIIDGMKPEAALILSGEDELLDTVDEKIAGGRKIVRYALHKFSDVRAENIVLTEKGQRFDIIDENGKRYKAEIPAVGDHNVLNALAAFCVGREFGMEPEEIVPALSGFKPSAMRQKIMKRGGVTYILDCYNASPVSMKAALSVLGSMQVPGRKIAVLGDMLELGEFSAKLHADVAANLAEYADECFLYGNEMLVARDELEKRDFPVIHCTDKERLVKRLAEQLNPGDAVLFKASRGIRMEEVAEKFIRRDSE